MKHMTFTKSLIALLIGMAAFILLIAEGDTARITLITKVMPVH